MANVKLLRQRVTDYQRNYTKNRKNYETAHTKYSTDTEAFNAMVQRFYDASAGMNRKSDLDLVGATYYDRDAGHNVSAGGTSNPLGTGTFTGFTPVEGASHNAYASWVPGSSHSVDRTDGEGNPYTETVIDTWNAVHNGQVIGSIPGGQTSGLYGHSAEQPYNIPHYAPREALGAFWDSYDKVWRNAPSGGVAPTQKKTQDINLTQKEVGILQGKVTPTTPLTIADEANGPSSAFANPEDPYNLKDAGILTRVIAGKL